MARKENQNYTKSAAKGVITIFIVSIAAAFLGYLVRFILARNLTIEDFGLFYAVFSFLGLIGVFKSLGFDKALAKFIPEFRTKNKNNLIKSSILYVTIIQLITNLIIIAGVFISANFLSAHFFHSEKASIVLRLMVFAFSLDSFVLVLKFTFQGFKRMLFFSSIDLIRMALVGIISIIGLKLKYGIISPVIAYIITPIVLLIVFSYIFIFVVHKDVIKSKFIVDKELIGRISKYSIFVMATSVGSVILGYSDIIMLTYFRGLKDVALYSVALPTAKLIMYFPRAVGGILLPLTSELWSKRKKNILADGMVSLYKYFLIIVLPIIITFYMFADEIIFLFYGAEFVAAQNALRILTIGMTFSIFYGVNINFFSGIGHPEITSKIIYIASLFNIVSNAVLIQKFGIVGAALATTLSYLIIVLISFKYIRKYINIKFPIMTWLKTGASSLVFISMILLFRIFMDLNVLSNVIIMFGVASLLYISTLLVLNTITIQEIKKIYQRIIVQKD